MLENDLNEEIVDAKKAVALTEERCAAIKQCIPEMMEQEKTEKERVTEVLHVSFDKV